MTTREQEKQAEALERARAAQRDERLQRDELSEYELQKRLERERLEYLQRHERARAEYEAEKERERLQRQADAAEIARLFRESAKTQVIQHLWEATADAGDLRTREALFEALKATRDSFLEA